MELEIYVNGIMVKTVSFDPDDIDKIQNEISKIKQMDVMSEILSFEISEEIEDEDDEEDYI